MQVYCSSRGSSIRPEHKCLSAEAVQLHPDPHGASFAVYFHATQGNLHDDGDCSKKMKKKAK